MLIFKKHTTLFFLLLSGFLCEAQHIEGIVQDINTHPLFGVTIQLDSSTYTTTDDNGYFIFENTKSTSTRLKVSMIGFLTQVKLFSQKNKHLTIILKEDVSQLSEIVIEGKTKEEEKRHTGYAIGVLKTKKLKNLNADINQVLKTTSGINIRETGGLGSGFNLSLNGLSGNQIRFFINGVPMENFGSSLTLNNYPINLVETIEIYKGVVPVSLGADALGGAINIITENKKASFIDASYSFGSFNTHRFAINAKYYNKEKKYSGVGTKLIQIFTKQLNGSLEQLDMPGAVFKLTFEKID